MSLTSDAKVKQTCITSCSVHIKPHSNHVCSICDVKGTVEVKFLTLTNFMFQRPGPRGAPGPQGPPGLPGRDGTDVS